MLKPLQIPQRTIMTPGPVEADPRVLQATSSRILGQNDPAFRQIMYQVKDLIKEVFQAPDYHALAVDGSGRSGLEAGIFALVEPGDKVLIPVYGRFGYLLAELVQRARGEAILLEREWDRPFEQEEIIDKIKEVEPKVVALVHGETATGQMQPVDQVTQYCQANGIYSLVDMVATYAGVETKVQEWGIDIAVAGSQKCVSVPAGLSLVTYSPRVHDLLQERLQIERGLGGTPNPRHIQSNYLDLSQLELYWSPNPINHHTEATTLIYGLHTGLNLLLEEGLDNVYERHALNARAIEAGIQAMGLEVYGNFDTKLPTVTAVVAPEGIDTAAVQAFLLQIFGIEIAGTFGKLKGKVWRIGNMGHSSRRENVLQVLGAFESTLIHFGADIVVGEAVEAALQVYLNARDAQKAND